MRFENYQQIQQISPKSVCSHKRQSQPRFSDHVDSKIDKLTSPKRISKFTPRQGRQGGGARGCTYIFPVQFLLYRLSQFSFPRHRREGSPNWLLFSLPICLHHFQVAFLNFKIVPSTPVRGVILFPFPPKKGGGDLFLNSSFQKCHLSPWKKVSASFAVRFFFCIPDSHDCVFLPPFLGGGTWKFYRWVPRWWVFWKMESGCRGLIFVLTVATFVGSLTVLFVPPN